LRSVQRAHADAEHRGGARLVVPDVDERHLDQRPLRLLDRHSRGEGRSLESEVFIPQRRWDLREAERPPAG